MKQLRIVWHTWQVDDYVIDGIDDLPADMIIMVFPQVGIDAVNGSKIMLALPEIRCKNTKQLTATMIRKELIGIYNTIFKHREGLALANL